MTTENLTMSDPSELPELARILQKVFDPAEIETRLNNSTADSALGAAEEILRAQFAQLEALKRERTAGPTEGTLNADPNPNVLAPTVGAQPTRASTMFPCESTVSRAISGNSGRMASDSREPGRRDPSDNSYNDRNERAPTRVPLDRPPDSSDSGDSPNSDHNSNGETDSSIHSDFLDDEPQSIITADSANTKARKRSEKRKHHIKLNKLKYQQTFLKENPPFIYKREVQIALFKKWCWEVRDWTKQARLSRAKSIRLAGKYLEGCAYRFYEHDMLELGKKYSLTQFFEGLFNYLFPADF